MPIKIPDIILYEPQQCGNQKEVVYQDNNVSVIFTIQSRNNTYYGISSKNMASPNHIPNNHYAEMVIKFKSFDTDPNKIESKTRKVYVGYCSYSNGLLSNYLLTIKLQDHNSYIDLVKEEFKNCIEEFEQEIKRASSKLEKNKKKQNYFNNIIGKL